MNKILCIFFNMIIFISLGCTSGSDIDQEYQYYISLLSKFPEDSQGEGFEPFYFTGELKDQPMTVGLVLASESLRFKFSPNEESRRRIRKAVFHLLENRDLDNDGAPGWGAS